MTITIKTIDIADIDNLPAAHAAATDAIMASATEIGFFCLTGTTIPLASITNMHALMRDIFAIDDAAKMRQAITRDNYRGYIPMSLFRPNGTDDDADHYEGFKLHHDVTAGDPIIKDCDLYGPNRWPDHCSHARAIILEYWQHLDHLTHQVLGLLETGLGLDRGMMTAPMHTPLTNMTLLHYPANISTDKDRASNDAPLSGIHPHKDTDILTIIAPDPVGGLEIRTPDGQWIEPDCPEGGVIVNIGDMLEVWSGGRLVSTPHRVVNRSGKERYSFPYFAVPRHDIVITPMLPPIAGFDRPAVHCGHWSREIWRTNWPDEDAHTETPALGTITD